MMSLAKRNPHLRDKQIAFDEGPHIYTIHGDTSFTSVTTWNHTHFPQFDANKIVNNIFVIFFISILKLKCKS